MHRIPLSVGQHVIHLRKLVSHKPISIILVHGLGVSGDYYIHFAKKLARYYDVYVIDLPGYGKTPKPVTPLTVLQLSEVLVNYVELSGIKKSVLVGQSMGCQIVAHAIKSSPHLFRKGILLAPTVNKKERTVLKQALRLFQDTFHESLSANCIVFLNYARMGVKRFIVTSKYMVDDHIEDTLIEIVVPILFISGSKDKIAPTKWVNALATVPMHGSAIEIQSAPHLLQFQKPNELVSVTRRYVES